eukprot:GDKI01018517.1.p2 GENE.GDKI01018517.1~~GDKI01018517.1.p2  ORF type:complete len:104 (+),score=6.48 GDKI01018517.1:145-456(+)
MVTVMTKDLYSVGQKTELRLNLHTPEGCRLGEQGGWWEEYGEPEHRLGLLCIFRMRVTTGSGRGMSNGSFVISIDLHARPCLKKTYSKTRSLEYRSRKAVPFL